MLRDWGIPTLGLQLGMRIPPGERGLLAVLSVQDLIKDKQWFGRVKDKLVYFGDGCIRLGLRRGTWSNPYQQGKDGGNHEVVLRWGASFLSNGSAVVVEQLRTLEGKILVCDCGLGTPCHARMASAMYQYYCVAGQCSSGKQKPPEGKQSRSSGWRRSQPYVRQSEIVQELEETSGDEQYGLGLI